MNYSDITAGGSAEPSFIVLGLGSNRPFGMMSPHEILQTACGYLSVRLSDMRMSSVYRTRAMYYTEQDDFYNMAVAGFFTGTPRELLAFIHETESRFGRDRLSEFRNGPRPLDIDIELFGRICIDEPDLQIPHPRLTERAFVLIPMLEILTESAEGIDKEFYAECLRKIPDQGVRFCGSG